jgi:hypothetical protein
MDMITTRTAANMEQEKERDDQLMQINRRKYVRDSWKMHCNLQEEALHPTNSEVLSKK